MSNSLSYPCLNIYVEALCNTADYSFSLRCLNKKLIATATVASLAPNANLLGTTPQEAALVDQWVTFGDIEINPLSAFINGMLAHRIPYSKPVRIWFATVTMSP